MGLIVGYLDTDWMGIEIEITVATTSQAIVATVDWPFGTGKERIDSIITIQEIIKQKKKTQQQIKNNRKIKIKIKKRKTKREKEKTQSPENLTNTQYQFKIVEQLWHKGRGLVFVKVCIKIVLLFTLLFFIFVSFFS